MSLTRPREALIDLAVAEPDDLFGPVPQRVQVAVALNNRGYAAASRGEYDRAIQDFSRALRLHATYAEGYNNRGLAWAASRRSKPRAAQHR